MKKFGVAYNVFDCGFELLPFSLDTIRDSVDFITVIYQVVSYTGNKATVNLQQELEMLKRDGMIDEYILFHPQPAIHPHQNETAKRNLGLTRVRSAGCDYAMSMDCDELYIPEEFDKMKQAIVDGGHDAAACQMLTYYKSEEYILDPPESYYVPLFYKVDGHRSYLFGSPAPVLVDPTRRIPSINWKIFTREEIQMHHFSYVREDIRKKLINSSAVQNYHHKLDEIVSDYVNFCGEKANIAGTQHSVKKIEPFFNLCQQ